MPTLLSFRLQAKLFLFTQTFNERVDLLKWFLQSAFSPRTILYWFYALGLVSNAEFGFSVMEF